jgi:hypothetical protein
VPELIGYRIGGDDMGAVGNQALLFALADSGVRQLSASAGSTHWSLQRNDPDRDRWLEVGRFPSRDVATMTMHALVAHDHGQRKDFRVKKVTTPARA